jgi:hypothetical protein
VFILDLQILSHSGDDSFLPEILLELLRFFSVAKPFLQRLSFYYPSPIVHSGLVPAISIIFIIKAFTGSGRNRKKRQLMSHPCSQVLASGK